MNFQHFFYFTQILHKKEIPTLTGNVILEIKPGTQNYTKLKLKGKGLKSPNSIMRGNMYVVVNIIIPTKLTLSQKKLFKELLDSNLDNEDEIKDFNRKMKQSKNLFLFYVMWNST